MLRHNKIKHSNKNYMFERLKNVKNNLRVKTFST